MKPNNIFPEINYKKKQNSTSNIKKTNYSLLDNTHKTIDQRENDLLNNKSVLLKRFNIEKEIIKNLSTEFKYKSIGSLGISKSVFKKSRTKMRNFSNITKVINMRECNIFAQSDPVDVKFFKDQISNPSLGADYLTKKFPILKNNFYKHQLYKYDNKFKINYQSKALDNTLIAFSINKDPDDRKYMNVLNTKYAQVSKLKIKWKTMKWLIDNKKDCLDRLLKFQENLLSKTKQKEKKDDQGLTKTDFSKLIITNGITNDQDLINKLFWIFDENGDGDLKYSEIAFGIEMFRDSSMEQKLKSFFDLCDEDGSGTISKIEFTNLFKKNLINSDERIGIKAAVDKIFASVDTDGTGEISFEELKIGCSKHKDIYDIIDKNLQALKSIDIIIDNDIKNDIMSFNPEANEQLRIKLLDQRVVFIPSRDKKFSNIIDGLVKNKELLNEAKILKDELKDSIIEEESMISDY